jgi:hypothetical protein
LHSTTTTTTTAAAGLISTSKGCEIDPSIHRSRSWFGQSLMNSAFK